MEVKLTKNTKRTCMGIKLSYPKGTVAYVDEKLNDDYWILDFNDGYVFKVKRDNFICL